MIVSEIPVIVIIMVMLIALFTIPDRKVNQMFKRARDRDRDDIYPEPLGPVTAYTLKCAIEDYLAVEDRDGEWFEQRLRQLLVNSRVSPYSVTLGPQVPGIGAGVEPVYVLGRQQPHTYLESDLYGNHLTVRDGRG